MNYFVHPTAIIDDGAQIGTDSKVWHFVHVSAGAKIGKNVSLGQNVYIGNKVSIGDNCKVQNNVSIYDKVILEDNVFCGPSVVFTNVINPRAEIYCEIKYDDGSSKTIKLLSRIDTENEIEYYKNGGILQYVLRNMLN